LEFIQRLRRHVRIRLIHLDIIDKLEENSAKIIFDSDHKQATGLFDGVQDLRSQK